MKIWDFLELKMRFNFNPIISRIVAAMYHQFTPFNAELNSLQDVYFRFFLSFLDLQPEGGGGSLWDTLYK